MRLAPNVRISRLCRPASIGCPLRVARAAASDPKSPTLRKVSRVIHNDRAKRQRRLDKQKVKVAKCTQRPRPAGDAGRCTARRSHVGAGARWKLSKRNHARKAGESAGMQPTGPRAARVILFLRHCFTSLLTLCTRKRRATSPPSVVK